MSETERALLVFCGDDEFWLPKSAIEYSKSPKSLIVDRDLIPERIPKSYISEYYHFAPTIEVKNNQEPMDELRFNPDECR